MQIAVFVAAKIKKSEFSTVGNLQTFCSTKLNSPEHNPSNKYPIRNYTKQYLKSSALKPSILSFFFNHLIINAKMKRGNFLGSTF